MLNAISWCHIQAGYTSVQLALEQKHEATVEVLLEAIVAAGMDIDARYESRRGGFGGFGAAATSTEQGQTLLMRASALGLTSTVAKLLALGADIAAKDAVLDNVCFSLFQFFFPSSLPAPCPRESPSRLVGSFGHFSAAVVSHSLPA